MKTVGVDKDISLDEPIRFLLETRDGRDFLVDPYRIDSVTVYFVSREFTNESAKSYDLLVENESVAADYESVRDLISARKKTPVAAATTAPVSLFGHQVVDGVSLSSGDRVLVKDQTDKSENGIYSVSSDSWDRSDDAKSFVKKSYVFVDEGIANAGSGWCLSTGGVIAVGSTPLTFVRFSENGVPSSPDQYSEVALSALRRMKSESAAHNEFHYTDALAVKKFGGVSDPKTGEFFPAWLNPELVPSELRDSVASENVLSRVYDLDSAVVGKFEVVWDPSGCREGDYFVCWSWRPTLSGETLSAHTYFHLGGGVGMTTSIPTHRTDPKKYEMLMERYLPEMFKSKISEGDLGPVVLKGLNESVGAGFTMIENLANQIIDLLDSNATHEQLLPLLSNLFAMKVKSSDPTLWRRQIKKAIRNFKKKGTIVGLKEAYGDAGMRLLRLVRLWQLVSEYTHQEHFAYEGSSNFELSRFMLTPTDSNFGLWFRAGGEEWEEVTDQASSLASFDGNTMTWLGPLQDGDSVRVLYRVKDVPPARQPLEDYIRLLPLMDNRDERLQDYPPKNWNVRVIEEDDPMFGVLVPVRHPLADPVIWGRVRTEFPYSENAYNMDEYNGSKRESINPCDIDKDFVDRCGGCQASVFNLDLEVENLSEGSFAEAVQVAEDNMPFHSMVHTFNISGSRTEFVGPVEERIETLITVSGGEVVLAGEAQRTFNRDVDQSEIAEVRRNILAGFSAVEAPSGGTDWHGTLRNARVCLFPSVSDTESSLNDPAGLGKTQGFDAYNINVSSPSSDPFESGNLLEILGATARYYTLSSIGPSAGEIHGIVDPSVVGPLFEYRVSNRLADFTVNITQADRTIFWDEDTDFYLLGVVSQRDIDDGVASGDAWRLRFESKEYAVLDLLPDNTILLEESSSSTPVSGWELWSGSEKVHSGGGGVKSVQKLGLVEVTDPPSGGVKSVVRLGDYLSLGFPSSVVHHRVRSYRSGEDKFYIEGYDGGDSGGLAAKVYRRIMESKVGQIGYDGLVLSAEDDLESLLPVSEDDSVAFLRDNYLVFIGSDYYTILDVDGSDLVLGGRLDSYTKAGQEVDFTVYRFSKNGLSLRERQNPPVPAFDFDFVDRSGKALVTSTQTDGVASVLSSALNATKHGQPFDVASQQESIDFHIEYRDGEDK